MSLPPKGFYQISKVLTLANLCFLKNPYSSMVFLMIFNVYYSHIYDHWEKEENT